ncbi:MAG TPA: hypothetical protein VJ596_01750 [Gemmatimonadaceae bacterium]|nr:hypothetical protein [Gemmatimonadaceae bacterium]
MRSLSIVSLAALIALGSASCASSRSATLPNAVPDVPPYATLRVQSNHWSDLIVYAVQDGIRTRLGTVTSSSTATFIVPPKLTESGRQFQLEGTPVGQRSTVIRMEPITLQPGMNAHWTVNTTFETSQFRMWR